MAHHCGKRVEDWGCCRCAAVDTLVAGRLELESFQLLCMLLFEDREVLLAEEIPRFVHAANLL